MLEAVCFHSLPCICCRLHKCICQAGRLNPNVVGSAPLRSTGSTHHKGILPHTKLSVSSHTLCTCLSVLSQHLDEEALPGIVLGQCACWSRHMFLFALLSCGEQCSFVLSLEPSCHNIWYFFVGPGHNIQGQEESLVLTTHYSWEEEAGPTTSAAVTGDSDMFLLCVSYFVECFASFLNVASCPPVPSCTLARYYIQPIENYSTYNINSRSDPNTINLPYPHCS